MPAHYDVIVVGARCAGAPTAMLLARAGYRVLLTDRAEFPSDTISTHMIHPPGTARLRRWGLLDEVAAGNCPPVERYSLDVGPFTLRGTSRPYEGMTTGYAPRRYVLDKILVDGADRAGVEVRERFSVDAPIIEDGTVVGVRGHGHGAGLPTVTEHARVVVGADGRNSHVAPVVEAVEYHQKAPLQWSYYTYWSNLPVEGMEIFDRGNRGWAALPTNDALTLLVVGWPIAEAARYKADAEGNYLRTLELAPVFADRVREATREDQFFGASVRSYFRTPFGPGWALVGDAGYNKDPITAQGITDAFRDAELCAGAIDAALSGAVPYDDAMSRYQQQRDADVLPIYEFTSQLAAFEPVPPEMQQLFAAVHGSQDAMDDFVSIIAGTVSPQEFFAPENIERIMAAAGAGAG
jgi:2-polyprenyl-6-methoxyphenol hydroxylase-like FAD-dependent oxidoreductase